MTCHVSLINDLSSFTLLYLLIQSSYEHLFIHNEFHKIVIFSEQLKKKDQRYIRLD